MQSLTRVLAIQVSSVRTSRWRHLSGILLSTSIFMVVVFYVLNMPSAIYSGERAININLASHKPGGLQAVYKKAFENPDGSVDIVFNIPKGGQELLTLDRQLRQRLITRPPAHHKLLDNKGNDSKNKTEVASDSQKKPAKFQIKTIYPLSLDADYLINPVRVCPEDETVDYLVIVHSATAYFSRRRAIRETYGGRGTFGHITQRLVFLLGTTSDPDTTRKIREEALLHKDIVQGTFSDSYHNLTHKGVLGFRWISEHCSQAKLIIKLDDDVFMNPFRVVKYILPKYTTKNRTIACHLRKKGTSPITRGKGKWKVDENEFKGLTHYPFNYCNGYFVVMTSDLIRPLLTAARINPFFWIDDVYLFGLLPATVGNTTFEDMRRNLTLRFDKGSRCYAEKGPSCGYVGVSEFIVDKADSLWYQVLLNMTSDNKEEFHLFGNS